ncbi:hypothetical protein [uncultured Marinobacter sp.]|uniref:hypothetical protein n=1 Tax=uncultured Marinobacter sp. TaxID=187379 RepID=UPI0030D7AC56
MNPTHSMSRQYLSTRGVLAWLLLCVFASGAQATASGAQANVGKGFAGQISQLVVAGQEDSRRLSPDGRQLLAGPDDNPPSAFDWPVAVSYSLLPVCSLPSPASSSREPVHPPLALRGRSHTPRAPPQA